MLAALKAKASGHDSLGQLSFLVPEPTSAQTGPDPMFFQ